jgi:regulator of protease activity HflC (stomatin/prohibitin superfamily)
LPAFPPADFALVALVVLLFATALLAVRIVPQANEWVVTRLGAYHRTLKAGVNLIVPFIERVHSRVSIADQVLSDVKLDVVSKDNVVFGIDLMVVYRVVEPEKAVFRVNDVRQLVLGLVKSLVRSEIGKVELDAVQQDRESLNLAIRAALAEAGDDYGLAISRSEVVDVQLNEGTQRAMAEVLEAERQRRAAISRAEGDKRAIELAADAELYQRRREAEAVRVTADATAYANGVIAGAIAAHGEAAARFQIAERQIEAVRALAAAPGSRLVLLPGDVTDGFTRAAAMLAGAGPDPAPGAPPAPAAGPWAPRP